MAFRSYGGTIWNDQSAESQYPVTGQALSLGVAAGAGLLAGTAATRVSAGGGTMMDWAAASARSVGNLSPFQLLNTFRIPEILSPFTSLQYKAGAEGLEGVTHWGKDYLKSQSTYEWLKYSTGRSAAELESAGITRKMSGDAATASGLIFEPSGAAGKGSLYSVTGGSYDEAARQWIGGTRQLLSRDMALLAMSHEVVDPISGRRGLNRVAEGVFAAADMHSTTMRGGGAFSGKKLLSAEVIDPVSGDISYKQAPFTFMPSSTGSIKSFGDLARRTNFVRGLAAFEMDRFNRLVSGVSEQFLGETGGKAFQKIFGVGIGIRPGPASAQFARFGGRAAAAGGLYMGLQQVDWARRNFGLPGEIGASAAISGGLSLGASKLGFNNRLAAMGGVASFFGQMVLPGFDQGVVQGLSTTAVNLDIMRANALNPFSYLRRTLEGFAPGITDPTTGALAGVAGMLAAGMQMPRGRGSLAQIMLESRGPSRLGLLLDPTEVAQMGETTKGVRRQFWQRVSGLSSGPGMPYGTMAERFRLTREIFSQAGSNPIEGLRSINAQWRAAEEAHELLSTSNPMNEALERRMQQISNKYGGPGLIQGAQREARGFAAQVKYSFFGANLGADEALRGRIADMGFGRLGKMPTPTGRLGRFGSIAAGAMLLHGAVTGGLLGSKETSTDLRRTYSGQKLVGVKSSRWWEAGGTPLEGGEEEYYRPHQYNLMMNRVREKGIWGADEDSISPIGKFLRKNFTYQLERQQYWDRPYPMSSAAFADVPIIGGVLASTIGKLIKPARVMHANEWMRPGGGGGLEYASVHQGSRREPALALGAHHGIPQDPYGVGAQASFLSYQFRELEGMTGWAKNVFQQGLTGEDTFGSDNPMLADSSMMTSPRVKFWEMQMGGALFANEFVRRILPRYRSEIERVNPLANSMPSWLPDKFHWGDPYRSVEWGEGRLPGSGYAALHPELQGVDPEGYPLIHRYAVLSDVAPFSPEYNMMKQKVYKRRQAGGFSQKEIDYMEAIDARHQRVVSGFQDDRMHENAIRLPGSGVTRDAWAFSQRQLRGAAAPAEYLVPMGFRPVQKLMGDRDFIEQYEYERLYGTPMAFWDKPWRDWLRPSVYSAAHFMGWDGKPVWRRKADATNEYFDKMEFIKWMTLEQQASEAGDRGAAQRYRFAASSTRMGVNPQGSPMGMYWTLPANERKFFNAFAHASGKDRHRILEMVPQDQAHLYQALWSRIDSGDANVWAGAPAQVNDQYMSQQLAGAQEYMTGMPQPDPDWIGWHEDVDMDDVRVRYVDRMGGELHDYGLWQSQLKRSMQQPFLEGAEQPLMGGGGGLGIVMRSVTGLPGARGQWQVNRTSNQSSAFVVNYNDNRDGDIGMAVERYMNGGI